jgi:hypothetical protein
VNRVGGSRLDTARLSAAIERTEAYIIANGYRGFDPYDCLKSPLFQLPLLRSSRRTRWGCQQALKRLPFQIRPLLGIKKGLNPVTLALTLQGITHRVRAGRTDTSETVSLIVSELSRLASPGFSGPCWGYDFDWQARYATIPAFHPTIVATGFVTNALYHLYRLDGDQRAAELVVESVGFVDHDLKRTEIDDAICWSYSPTDRQQVLNASIKGARLCAQAYSITQDESLLELATRAVRFVVAAQREDGSWPYSVSDRRSWTDNFHTCYILDCLDDYETLTGDGQFARAKAKGLRFYLDHFIAPDGVAAYYHDRRYPLDSTAAGQALLTLSRFGEIERAERLAEWSLDHLALPGGAWKYRIYRYGENRLVYMRWSVAWMYLGLSALELAEFASAS